MSNGSESCWVGKKPSRCLGGISDALSLAAGLGFTVASAQDDGDDDAMKRRRHDDSEPLIRMVRELCLLQKKITHLQVELSGRKEDRSVGHLTHVREMEDKCETLARMTSILEGVIQNKDRIIARVQQPYSLDCIPIEAEHQRQFSELLMRAASDCASLTASVGDFQWSEGFREPPSVWPEMLRSIPAALASCTRFFEALLATRQSFATLHRLRNTNHVASCVTPPPHHVASPTCITPVD